MAIAAWGVLSAPPFTFALDLEEALREARKNAVEIEEPQAELERAKADVRGVRAMYDWTLFGNSRWAQDRSEQASAFAGDRRDQAVGEFGARRLLPSATFFQASVKHQRDFTKFPAISAVAGADIPGGGGGATDSALPTDAAAAGNGAGSVSSQAPPILDPSKFQTFNPAYGTRADFIIKQPLWRNWLGRELRLQEEVAGIGTVQPEYDRRIRLIAVQAETEQLFWALAGLEAHIGLTQTLLDKSRRFADLMRKRTALGRSDEVDVATADAAVIAMEGNLLNLETAADDVRHRLAIRLGSSMDFADIRTPSESLTRTPLASPAGSSKEAKDSALKTRQDLALIAAMRRSLGSHTALANEQQKPGVSLIGSMATSGLEGDAAPSLGDSVDDPRHLTYFVGLEFEMNLDRTGPRSKRESVSAQIAALSARARTIERDANREIELAFQALDSAARKKELAERHIRILEEKVRAEREKFQQARSEEVVVLRYEMEVLGAEADRITALREAREAEARLRLALHAYPTE
ncbi:MAG: TolC family protein [Nitrospirae bacterium]|nr:TolC family protein [Nitrospirota bacterium]